MNRVLCFVFLMVVMGPGAMSAQVGMSWNEGLSELLKKKNIRSVQNFSALQGNSRVLFSEKRPATFSPTQQEELGVFCNFDLNLDKNLPFKLRFRLGEYHYTRRLEYGDNE